MASTVNYCIKNLSLLQKLSILISVLETVLILVFNWEDLIPHAYPVGLHPQFGGTAHI
jgi:hypothetical protein